MAQAHHVIGEIGRAWPSRQATATTMAMRLPSSGGEPEAATICRYPLVLTDGLVVAEKRADRHARVGADDGADADLGAFDQMVADWNWTIQSSTNTSMTSNSCWFRTCPKKSMPFSQVNCPQERRSKQKSG